MPLTLWPTLLWKIMRFQPRRCLLFIIILTFGLVGFLTVDAFNHSVRSGVRERSRQVAAADMVVSAPQPFTDLQQEKLRQHVPKDARFASEVSFLSMLSAGDEARLSDVHMVDGAFPLYGEITLEGETNKISARRLQEAPLVWVAPELLVQLNIKKGDTVQLGELALTVNGVIKEDPTASLSGFALAPRIYVALPFLEQTKLIQPGSRVTYWQKMAFPGDLADRDMEETEKNLQAQFASGELKIRSHISASEEIGRLLTIIGDYLGLVGLVALFLGAVGAFYVFQVILQQEGRTLAILRSLGATPAQAQLLLLAYLLSLSFCASILATLISLGLLPIFAWMLAPLLGGEALRAELQAQSVLVAAAVACVGSFIFCAPLWFRARQVKVAQLFQEASEAAFMWRFLSFLPGLVVFWLLCFAQVRSVKIASIFFALFVGAGFLLIILGSASLQFIRKRYPRLKSPWDRGMALVSLARTPGSTLAIFLSLSLGSLLMNLIPQLRHVLTAEIAQPSAGLPSLFLFDIQETQLPSLKEKVGLSGASLQHVSPLIRARLQTINGKPAADHGGVTQGTREWDERQQFLNRGQNLSYRQGVFSSESLVEGRPMSGVFDEKAGLPPISLEVGFAKKLGVGVGDTLGFDVQGMLVEGRVVNLRRVRWTSFQPNFFVQFQPGVLDDAPKTFLASVPPLDVSVRRDLQITLTRQFNNVSVVDVTATVERVGQMIEQILNAMSMVALLCFITSSAVLFSVAQQQAMKRGKEIALLKILGAAFPAIRRAIVQEYLWVSGAGAALGCVLGVVVSYGLSRWVFNAEWRFDAMVPFGIFLGLVVICQIVALSATHRALETKPIRLINS